MQEACICKILFEISEINFSLFYFFPLIFSSFGKRRDCGRCKNYKIKTFRNAAAMIHVLNCGQGKKNLPKLIKYKHRVLLEYNMSANINDIRMNVFIIH